MQNTIHRHISSLLALAHDRTETGRATLAGKLIEVFFAENVVLTRREEALVNDLVDELMKSEHETVRRVLVDRFTAKIDAPRAVAIRMAASPISLAESVLKENMNLLDDDLITIVETKGSAHAQAIAMREKVSEAVADALVETGDVKVMQVVAENLGAHLSRHAIEVLTTAARLSAMLQKPLLSRTEMNPEAAATLYWWVSKDLRRATMERFGFGPGKLESELTRAVDEMLSSHFLQKDDESAMQHLADWLAEREAFKTDVVLQVLRAGHYKLFSIILARVAQLDVRLTKAIMTDKGSPMMAALCKALGIDKGKFISMFLMSRGGRPDEQVVSPRELSKAIATYDRLKIEIARSMVQTWRVDPETALGRIDDGSDDPKVVRIG